MRYEGIFVYRESRSSEIRSERRVVDKSMRKEVSIIEKRQLTEEIEVLVRQLVMQDHIAQVLLISRRTAYEVMRQQDFPLLKIGKCMRVPREQFFQWIENKHAN